MTDQPNNLPSGETDKVMPEADTPETFDYYDPDDDQDTVEAEAAEGTEDEGDTEAEAEAVDETETEEAEAADEPKQPETVKLQDGSEVTFDELTKGYLRQSDYTRKQQETANERKALAEGAARIERITQTFVDHLASMVPPEPNPQLALTDPGKFTAQKAQYDAALAQVQQLMKIADEPKQVRNGMSREEHAKLQQAERAKLVEALPAASTQDGMKAVYADLQSVAQQVGFSADEVGQVIDHRFFVLADWAKKGMEADRAATAAKAKAQKAPPAAPRKPGQPAKAGVRNVEAMRKLGRTGSIRDAMAVDFD